MAKSSDLVPVLGLEKVSPEFKEKVVKIAENLKIDPNYLTAIISFETNYTFSPAIKNLAGSDATGLIQFLPSTAKGLGTSVEELAKMSPEEQLDYVAKYFEPYKGQLNSLEDVYMAVLYPKAIGKDKEAVLFQQGTKEYTQNQGLDRNKDGSITVSEATRQVRQILRHGIALQSVQKSRSQPSSLVQQQPSHTDNQSIFKQKIAEKQLYKPNYQSFHSEVVGSGQITGGFMEPHGHGKKSFTTKFISGSQPDKLQTREPGNYNIGIDYTVDDWKVRALYGGTVTRAGYEGGYGNRIHVKTDLTFEFQGKEYPVYAAYAHLDSIEVQPGEKVEQGEQIGIMGNTGASNGAHVDLATWIEVNGEKIYVSPNLLDEQLSRQSGIDPTLKVTAVTDAAQTILAYKGTVTEDGQEFQGNTYNFSDRNGVLSVTKGDTEILRVDNGNISVNKVSDLDLMCLSRAAYEINYGEYPAVSSPADVTLTAITLANAAETVAKLDPRSRQSGNRYVLEGHDYDILLQEDNLCLEAKDGRGVILEVQNGQIEVNRATAEDVAILSNTGFVHSHQAQPTFLPVLRHGDRGTEVSFLQTRLNELGYLDGDIDGMFGPQTEVALKRFQEKNGLKVDGIAGPNTWQSLSTPSTNQIRDMGNLQLVSDPTEDRAVDVLQNAYGRVANYVRETLERFELEGVELDVYIAQALLNAGESINNAAQVLIQGPKAQALYQQDPAEVSGYIYSCLEQASERVQQKQSEMVLE